MTPSWFLFNIQSLSLHMTHFVCVYVSCMKKCVCTYIPVPCLRQWLWHAVFAYAGHHKVTSLPLQHLQSCQVSVQWLEALGHVTTLLLLASAHLPSPWILFFKPPPPNASPSFFCYRGGNELMNGERQHVTHNSTLQYAAIPPVGASHQPLLKAKPSVKHTQTIITN